MRRLMRFSVVCAAVGEGLTLRGERWRALDLAEPRVGRDRRSRASVPRAGADICRRPTGAPVIADENLRAAETLDNPTMTASALYNQAEAL